MTRNCWSPGASAPLKDGQNILDISNHAVTRSHINSSSNSNSNSNPSPSNHAVTRSHVNANSNPKPSPRLSAGFSHERKMVLSQAQHTLSHTNSLRHRHTDTETQRHTHTLTHTHTHTHTQTRTQILTRPYSLTHSLTLPLTHQRKMVPSIEKRSDLYLDELPCTHRHTHTESS